MKTCSIAGCTSRVNARGWCTKHYQRWKNRGDPLAVAWERGNPQANFWAKVDRRGPEECWPWLAYKDPDGYGHFAVPVNGRQNDTPAHRYAYELEVGLIPDGHHIDHTCHNKDRDCPAGVRCLHRRCCNPAHLEPVLPGENIRRAPVSPGQRRAVSQRAKTHCPKGHPYNEVNTRIEGGEKRLRRCRSCERMRKGLPELVSAS